MAAKKSWHDKKPPNRIFICVEKKNGLPEPDGFWFSTAKEALDHCGRRDYKAIAYRIEASVIPGGE